MGNRVVSWSIGCWRLESRRIQFTRAIHHSLPWMSRAMQNIMCYEKFCFSVTSHGFFTKQILVMILEASHIKM